MVRVITALLAPSKSRTRPVIGITTSAQKSTLAWLCDLWSVWRAGGRAVRIKPDEEIPPVDSLDGLVIGGGDDIGAQLYDGEVSLDVRIDPERDRMEQRLLNDALKMKMPVLGICRGSQMINVHLGGTLLVDVYETFHAKRKLRTVLPRMHVDVRKDSMLRKIVGRDRLKVNSLHHQAVDRLGDGLSVCARDETGVIQATESKSYPFLLGVQWHPEFLIFTPAQHAIFRAMIDKAAAWRDRAQRP